MSPEQMTQRLKVLTKELGVIQTELADRAGSLPLKDEVDIGQALWRIGNLARLALEPVKDSLRGEALERSGARSGAQFLSGRQNDARCTVHAPRSSFSLREGISLSDLQDELGSQAPLFFHVQVRPDFQDQVKGQPDGVLATLVRLVDMGGGTSRISFRD